jgi:hypothetical protein
MKHPVFVISLLILSSPFFAEGGKFFSYDPRTEMGKSITAAESAKGG